MTKEAFEKWWDRTFSYHGHIKPQIWQYFAPHHLREEFDYEGFSAYALREYNIRPSDQFLECLRLWNGGEASKPSIQPLIKGKWYLINGHGPFMAGSESIRIMDNEMKVVQVGEVEDLAPHFDIVDLPVCPTCGGSGDEPTQYTPRGNPRPALIPRPPCPDCESKCLRCMMSKRKFEASNARVSKCVNEGCRFTDTRKVKQRVREFDHGRVDDPKHNGVFSMEIYSLDKGKIWLENYRSHDRREGKGQ